MGTKSPEKRRWMSITRGDWNKRDVGGRTLAEKKNALGSLSLLSFPFGGEEQETRSRGGTEMICERVNVSHLTCNKAEQITCWLPLNVRPPPQGVPISFNTLSSVQPPRSQRFFSFLFYTKGTY